MFKQPDGSCSVLVDGPPTTPTAPANSDSSPASATTPDAAAIQRDALVNEGREQNPAPLPSSAGCANGMFKQPDGSCSIYVNGPPTATPTTPTESTPTNNTDPTNGNLPAYVPLEPIPGIDQSGQAQFGKLISQIFKILIIAGQIITVAAFVYYGIMYMFSATSGKLADAKNHLWGAVVGLLLLIGSWLILNTINPQLLVFSGGLNPQTGNFTNGQQAPKENTLASEVASCESTNGKAQNLNSQNCSQVAGQVTGICNNLSNGWVCITPTPTANQQRLNLPAIDPKAGII